MELENASLEKDKHLITNPAVLGVPVLKLQGCIWEFCFWMWKWETFFLEQKCWEGVKMGVSMMMGLLYL